ncbi:MAG: SUMF1/EgtB/PvdO family nonheme iron enzyme, partial [Lentisphaeraceae bacterium]|nr:SUMF1/EgtB/PvdO family nonheme iron enzyme [Lentisphaeraceae bacterium]
SDAAELRVVRGGSWYNQPLLCRSAARGFYDAPMASVYVGFRVVCED